MVLYFCIAHKNSASRDGSRNTGLSFKFKDGTHIYKGIFARFMTILEKYVLQVLLKSKPGNRTFFRNI